MVDTPVTKGSLLKDACAVRIPYAELQTALKSHS